jgi:hypothetical protein
MPVVGPLIDVAEDVMLAPEVGQDSVAGGRLEGRGAAQDGGGGTGYGPSRWA